MSQNRTKIIPAERTTVSVFTTKRFLLLELAALFLLIVPVCAQTKELAATPPMGWNSWNHFGAKVTDKDVRAAADALVSSGMRDAGYIYVNIDDGWQGARDAQGNIRGNERFPDMKALADYVHSKGLKLGIYSSPGPKTCARYEGSYGHEEQDAKMYAEWGVDFLKYDLCSFGDIMKQRNGGEEHRIAYDVMREAYEKMHLALAKAKRQIVYSYCQYGHDAVWEWGPSLGANLWRTTGDIQDNYDRMSLIGFSQAGLAKYAGPGHWNDPDMLEVGNGGMKRHEYLTHMSLWAILAAPLLAGNDLSIMDSATREILTNREVIAIDQDPLGIQGDRVLAVGPVEVWMKPLSNGAKAVGLFNRGSSELNITLNLRDVGFSAAEARDVWAHKDLGELKSRYTRLVPSHGVVLLVLRPRKS